MTEKEQIQALADDLDRLIERYCNEFELTTASAVGVLMFKVHLLMVEAQRNPDGGESD